MTGTPANSATSDPVWQAARAGDRDRYFCALLAPKSERTTLMTIAAFSGDLAAIAETSSDPQLGEIRLQWWREALDRVNNDEPAGTPIGDALADALAGRHGLIPLLKGIVDAKSFDIQGGAMPDQSAARAYFEKTQATLFRLPLELMGIADRQSLETARLAGLAYGQARALCLFEHNLSRGRMFLPRALLERHGLTPEQVFDEPHSPQLAASLAEWRAEAVALERDARLALRDCSAPARRALLPFALTRAELSGLARAAKRGQINARLTPLGRLARLVWAAFRGRP